MTPFSQKCGEKQLGITFKVVPYLSFLEPFKCQEISCLCTKKIAYLLFCIFQTKLNKAVKTFCRVREWIRNVQMIPGFSTIKTWMKMVNSKD